MMSLEFCRECDEATGNAGRNEDSIYFGQSGPYCSDCYDKLIEELPGQLNEMETALESVVLFLKRLGT